MWKCRLLTMVACGLISSPMSGQSVAAPVTPQAAVESFLRVASFVGKPMTELARIWPKYAGQDSHELLLTAAHRIRVSVNRPAGAADSGGRVMSVGLTESISDTLTLARRVSESMQLLQRKYGAPDRCSDPLGPPAYLFASQHVTRGWRAGPAGQPLTLQWVVTGEKDYEITMSVSQVVNPDASMACDAKMP
jgi:hypothetical protein